MMYTKITTQDMLEPRADGADRIAVPFEASAQYENGSVFQHFGHTAQFKLYDAQNGTITARQLVNTNGSGHAAIAAFLESCGVTSVICGGIGDGARSALNAAHITVYGGVSGDADEAAAQLVAGTLSYDPNARCDHHDHGHQ